MPVSIAGDRRLFLQRAAAMAAVAVLPGRAVAGNALRFMALGQAAIQHDLREHVWPGYGQLAALLKPSHVCFTDLETAILGPGSGAPTRNTGFDKAAEPVVLDCLKDWSVNLLALSNNHAWDLNTGGILATREAVRACGFSYAGTGANLDEATAPGYRDTPGGKVALVSMASGAIRDGAAATATRAGVNEVRLEADRRLNAEDVARNLAAIREAARNAAHVFAYQHDHYWEKDFRITPDWKRGWARQCIDAGACAFISHGAPLLHGIELYRGRPIFYNLGSVVFHTKTRVGHYIPEVWDSAVADCVFEDGRLASLDLVPVALNESGLSEKTFYQTRGRPTLAQGSDAARILSRLQQLSLPYGSEIRVSGDAGRLVIPR